MRTLLRNIHTGEYLQSFETWTANEQTALDFASVGQALELVRRRGLKHMELVLEEMPAQLHSVPLAKLDPAAFAPPEERTPAPRRVAAAGSPARAGAGPNPPAPRRKPRRRRSSPRPR